MYMSEFGRFVLATTTLRPIYHTKNIYNLRFPYDMCKHSHIFNYFTLYYTNVCIEVFQGGLRYSFGGGDVKNHIFRKNRNMRPVARDRKLAPVNTPPSGSNCDSPTPLRIKIQIVRSLNYCPWGLKLCVFRGFFIYSIKPSFFARNAASRL